MRFLILDAYTDEPSGLGVPPYIGTYPRYYYGAVLAEKKSVNYFTIDDLRNFVKINLSKSNNSDKEEIKTNIKIYNLTKTYSDLYSLLDKTDFLIINSGVQTPGKYLSAYPGTIKEILNLLEKVPKEIKHFKTILAGPGADIGEGLFGGKKSDSKKFNDNFDYVIKDFEYKFSELINNNFQDFVLDQRNSSYSKINKISILGAKILKEINYRKPEQQMIEIETMKGCKSKTQCSFCTEKLKNPFVDSRDPKDIIEEIKALHKEGAQNFRLGKQTCFYSYGTNETLNKLLSGAKKFSKILHIDNVNPKYVTEEKTKTIVRYTTPGNVAAFGVESFDEKVIKSNFLNTYPEETFKAIKIINKYGKDRGDNGMPKFLPGINILFGLNQESKKTHEKNMFWLNKIKEENLLIRRVNIREVVVFDNTPLSLIGTKFIKKNKKYYWKWRNEIRQEFDIPMLKSIVPKNTILKDAFSEIHDGNTTFLRQIGTYPLVIGVKKRLELNKKYNIKITDFMKRSVTGEVIK